MSACIRKARAPDAEALARVETRAWRDTYPAILPSEILARPVDLDHMARRWRQRIMRPAGTRTVVAEIDQAVVGYASAGRCRLSALACRGELYELYLLGDYQGLGLGRCLLAAVAEDFLRTGVSSLCVEVLEGNPARFFYEARGARLVARKTHPYAGLELASLVYAWDDLASLVGASTR